MTDRREKARVLVVDARVPTPDRDGGSLRLTRILGLLLGLGCRVSFAPWFADSFSPYSDHLEEDTTRLRRSGIDVLERSVPFRDHLEREGREYDVVIVCSVTLAVAVESVVRRTCPRASLVFDTVDLSHVRLYREARLRRNVPLLRRALRTKARELEIVRRSDCTFAVSPAEREVLLRECAGAVVHVVPNVHEAPGTEVGFEERRDLLFLGSFDHPPNVDAVEWMVDSILPALRRRLPGVRLHVVGNHPPEAFRAFPSEAVTVHGFVPDLHPLLESARLLVAPLRFGAGIKGKVLVAMGHGLPVVTSPIGAEGIDATNGEHLLVAGPPESFVGAVVSLYEDGSRWRTLSERGAARVARDYSPARVSRALSLALEDLVVRRPEPRA